MLGETGVALGGNLCLEKSAQGEPSALKSLGLKTNCNQVLLVDWKMFRRL